MQKYIIEKRSKHTISGFPINVASNLIGKFVFQNAVVKEDIQLEANNTKCDQLGEITIGFYSVVETRNIISKIYL